MEGGAPEVAGGARKEAEPGTALRPELESPLAHESAPPLRSLASRPARPMLLQRGRLPIAGTGAVAWRGRPLAPRPSQPCQAQPSHAAEAGGCYKRLSPSAASVAAGAIASGRNPDEVHQPAVSSSRSVPAAAPSEGNLSARMAQLERLNHQQATKLARQTRDLSVLRAELEHLKREQEHREEVENNASEVEELRQELDAVCADRDRYRQQVEDMTKFLADYGMTWLGDCEEPTHLLNGDISDDEPPRPSSAAHRTSVAESLARPCENSSVEVNIAEIESRVCGLNAMVERAAQVVRDSRGGTVHARFVMDDAPPLPLTFFADGIKLGSHTFRPYSSMQAQQVLHDVLDGYFPYELKAEYPDGVCLKVVDRMAHEFDDWMQNLSHDDKDLLAGGDRLAPRGARVLHSGTSKRPPKLPGGAPKQDAGDRPRTGSTPPAPVLAHEVSLLRTERAPDQPIAKLQVRLHGHRLIFSVETVQTIGELEDAIVKWCEENAVELNAAGSRKLLLRAAFPPREFAKREETVESAGLAPSATLFASPVVA